MTKLSYNRIYLMHQNDKLLLTIYIKGGIARFNEHVNAVIQKKKNKRTTAQQTEDNKYSIYNFIEIKPYTLKHSILSQEMIRLIQNKERSKQIFHPNNNKIMENIEQFRMLYHKLIKVPNYNEKQKQIQYQTIYKGIVYKQSQIWLRQYLEDSQLEKQIQRIDAEIKHHRSQNSKQHIKINQIIDKKVIEIKSQYQTMAFAKMQRKQMQRQCSVPQIKVDYNWRQAQQKILAIKMFHIQYFFKQIIKQTVLKEIQSTSKISLNWQSNFVQKEQYELMSRKITGKVLYSVEQNIAKLKRIFQNQHYCKEYFIRQKKYGLHANIFKGEPVNKYRPTNYQQTSMNPEAFIFSQYKEPDRSNSDIFDKKGSDGQRRERGNDGRSNSVPNPTNKLYSNSQTNNQSAKVKQLTKYIKSDFKPNIQKYHLSQFSKQLPTYPEIIPNTHNVIKLSKNSNYQHQPPSNQTALRSSLKDRKTFQASQSHKIKNRLIPKSRKQLINAMNKVVQKVEKARKQLKYPIKIEECEMLDAQTSNICYNVQTISMKELPLRFIKDRLKYKQNRVKIQYPLVYSPAIEEVVLKSMHILSCLGAQVFSQVQAGYIFWNQVQNVDILIVSWINEIPLKQAVKYYGLFLDSVNSMQ